MRLLMLCVAALLAAVSSGTAAACYEPSAPYCVSSYSSFTDQYEFDSCRREVESFKDETEAYMRCNNEEAEEAAREAAEEANRKNSSAADEYSDAVESFNRRANN